MFELTSKHLALITADVDKADVSYSHLKYDLIDHICCDLENEMSRGIPFEKAYDMVKQKIGMRGLQQIQEDTLSLIDKKYRIMKNTMKIFGVIAPILMAFGSLFKIQHWPGAGIMLVLGFFLLCFVFLPSAIYVSYREVSNRTKLFLHFTGFLTGFLFAAGFLFKIQHWPGAGILILTASVAAFGFIPAFFINQWKQSEPGTPKTAIIVGFLGSLIYLAGFLFKVNHWPGATIAYLSGTVLLIFIALPVFVISHYKTYQTVSSRFIFATFAVIWFIVPTMLISLNISKDVRKDFIDKEVSYQFNIQHLNLKNARLLGELEGIKYYGNDHIRAFVGKVQSSSDELVDYLQNLKLKIVSAAGTDAIGENQQINLETIIDEDWSAGKKVLFEQGEAKNVKEKIIQFRQSLLQDTVITNSSKPAIQAVLATEAPDKETPEFFGNWERKSMLSFTMITMINRLSALQEKIRTAENIALGHIKNK